MLNVFEIIFDCLDAFQSLHIISLDEKHEKAQDEFTPFTSYRATVTGIFYNRPGGDATSEKVRFPPHPAPPHRP